MYDRTRWIACGREIWLSPRATEFLLQDEVGVWKGKMSKMSVPNNQPLCVVTFMLWCQLIWVFFSVTHMMRKSSWFESRHCEHTQSCITSTLVSALIGCKQPCQVADVLGCESSFSYKTIELICVCTLYFLSYIYGKQKGMRARDYHILILFWLFQGLCVKCDCELRS